MEREQQIDIVITTWKREWMTRACLSAILQNTTSKYRIILVDNGSSSEAQAKYVDVADIYVKLDQNYGLEYAKHIGMEFVTSEYFVSMDNDILPYQMTPDWLSRLVGLMKSNPTFGAIALRPQVLVGTSMDMFNSDKEVIEFPHVPGYGRIMRTDIVKAVGAWNSRRPMRGHEEMWIGDKFRENGWKMGWAKDVRCYHLWGKDGEDMWGYNEESGHNPVWPVMKNDYDLILKETGVKLP